MSCSVRPALASDAHWFAQIYNHYIEHSVATFEELEVSTSEIQQRMAAQVT
jgi:L-amino acid N-acyltransferase YncA